MTTKPSVKDKGNETKRIADFDQGLDPFADTPTEMVKIDKLLDLEIIVDDRASTEMTSAGELVKGVGFVFHYPNGEGHFRSLSWSKVLTEQLLRIERREFPLLGAITEKGTGTSKYMQFI